MHGVTELRALRDRTTVPLAMDETDAPGSGATQLVCLKISRAGGIGALLAKAAFCHAVGEEVYLASTLDGPLGIAAAVHCAAALRDRAAVRPGDARPPRGGRRRRPRHRSAAWSRCHARRASAQLLRRCSVRALDAGTHRNHAGPRGRLRPRARRAQRAARRLRLARPRAPRRPQQDPRAGSRGPPLRRSRARPAAAPRPAARRARGTSRRGSPARTVAGIVSSPSRSHSGSIEPGADPAQRRRERGRARCRGCRPATLPRPAAACRRTAAALSSGRRTPRSSPRSVSAASASSAARRAARSAGSSMPAVVATSTSRLDPLGRRERHVQRDPAAHRVAAERERMGDEARGRPRAIASNETGRRAAAVAVAAEVRGERAIAFAVEAGDDRIPQAAGAGEAVQEDDRLGHRHSIADERLRTSTPTSCCAPSSTSWCAAACATRARRRARARRRSCSRWCATAACGAFPRRRARRRVLRAGGRQGDRACPRRSPARRARRRRTSCPRSSRRTRPACRCSC